MKAYKVLEDEPEVITTFNELDLNKTYSYADYLRWQFSERVELIKGHIFKMAAAPSMHHQRVSSRLHIQLGKILEKKGKKCEIFAAPFDVRFPKKSTKDEDIYDTVQPDLCILCDLSKLDDRGFLGVPDLIVEILSPSSSKRDLKNKYELYESHKVQEYWVVHPREMTLLVYSLGENGKYRPSRLFTSGDVVQSEVLPALKVNLDQIFDYD